MGQGLIIKIIKLLETDPGQVVKDLAEKPRLAWAFLSNYLKVLKNQGYVKSKKNRIAMIYFKENKGW